MSFMFGMGYYILYMGYVGYGILIIQNSIYIIQYYPGTTPYLQTRLIEGTPTVFGQGHSNKELVLLAFCLMSRQLSHLSAKPVKPTSIEASCSAFAGTSSIGFGSSVKLEGQMGSISYSSWKN